MDPSISWTTERDTSNPELILNLSFMTGPSRMRNHFVSFNYTLGDIKQRYSPERERLHINWWFAPVMATF